jgi:hypothetical protein
MHWVSQQRSNAGVFEQPRRSYQDPNQVLQDTLGQALWHSKGTMQPAYRRQAAIFMIVFTQ